MEMPFFISPVAAGPHNIIRQLINIRIQMLIKKFFGHMKESDFLTKRGRFSLAAGIQKKKDIIIISIMTVRKRKAENDTLKTSF